MNAHRVRILPLGDVLSYLNRPTYFDKFTGVQILELCAVVIAAYFAIQSLALQPGGQTAIYCALCLWLFILLTRVNASKAGRLESVPLASAVLVNLLIDGFVLGLICCLIAIDAEMPAGVLIATLVAILVWILGVLLHRFRSADAAELSELRQSGRGEVADLEKHARRVRCYLRWHDWQPHTVLDHLCICTRCTEIAQHAWQGDVCTRCGASR